MTSEISDTRLTRPAAAKKLEVRRSHIYGMGCFALMRLPARKKFALYAGEIIRGYRRIEARLRTQDAVKVIRLRDDMAIDGRRAATRRLTSTTRASRTLSCGSCPVSEWPSSPGETSLRAKRSR
jgi:hypothetical protein